MVKNIWEKTVVGLNILSKGGTIKYVHCVNNLEDGKGIRWATIDELEAFIEIRPLCTQETEAKNQLYT
jgi:hypothetical protein